MWSDEEREGMYVRIVWSTGTSIPDRPETRCIRPECPNAGHLPDPSLKKPVVCTSVKDDRSSAAHCHTARPASGGNGPLPRHTFGPNKHLSMGTGADYSDRRQTPEVFGLDRLVVAPFTPTTALGPGGPRAGPNLHSHPAPRHLNRSSRGHSLSPPGNTDHPKKW
jgi:hypothetical protein